MEQSNYQNTTTHLQQKLLSTRYSVVEQIVNIKSSMDKQKINKKQSQDRFVEMRKKILFLENRQKQVNCQAKLYQRKLQKLQQSQDMIFYMAKLKSQNIKDREEDLSIRRSFCSDVKQGLNEHRSNSLNYFERKKRETVSKIKEQNFKCFLQKQKRSEEQLESRRKNKQKIRERQAIARERLRRYEAYKLAQAEFNYELKRQKQAYRREKLNKQLHEFKKEEQEEQIIYRKTQFLQKQTRNAESFYLTNNQ